MRVLALISLLCAVVATACGGDDEPFVPSPADARPAPVMFDAQVRVQCTGTPTACPPLLLLDECEDRGCTALRDCSPRFGFSCFGLTTEAACSEVGCEWTSECLGPGTCFLAHDPSSCAAREGCAWDSYCDPLSDPSDAYCGGFDDEPACEASAAGACAWSYQVCSGTPAPCETVTEEAACAARVGCTWQP